MENLVKYPANRTTTIGSAQFAVAAAKAEFKRVLKLKASEGIMPSRLAVVALLHANNWLVIGNAVRAAGQNATAGRRYGKVVQESLHSLFYTVGPEHETFRAVLAVGDRYDHNEYHSGSLPEEERAFYKKILELTGDTK